MSDGRIGSALLLVLALAAPAAASSHDYHYFKTPRPLTLDVTRVAVPGNVEASGFGAWRLSLEPDHDQVAGWTLLSTPPDRRSAQDVEHLVAEIASRTGHFVTPVFLDELGGPLLITSDVLLRFRPGVDPIRQESVLADLPADVLDRDWAGMRGGYRVRAHARNGFDVLALANALATRNDIRFAEPDARFTGLGGDGAFPDDPLFGEQWGMHSTGQDIGAPCSFTGTVAGCDLDAPEAWKSATGGPAVTIVIIDDGVQLDHPDLLVDVGTDCTNDPGARGGGPVNDCDNHGTLTAGPAFARWNDTGVVGVAPAGRAASARTFISRPMCDGSWDSQPSWTVCALEWARTIGARVTNNSNVYGFESAAVADMYAQTRDEDGMVHFGIPGNAGIELIGWPASLEAVNCVTNMGPLCQLNATSNFGDGVAFCAPGTMIVTTDRTGAAGRDPGDHACTTGTSIAAPHAAGVAALVLAVAPSLSAAEVEQLLRDAAVDMGDPGYDIRYGWGRINAADALALALACPEDLDGDGTVGVADLLTVLGAWGAAGGDVTGDGTTDVADLLAVLSAWGECA